MSERLGLHASLLLSSCLTLDYCNLSAPEFSSSPWWQQHVCQQIWKTQQGPQYWKRSLFIPVPKKGNAKECSNYHTIALISHASKVMPQIFQARLQQYVNCELPDVQAGFKKAEEPEIKLPTSAGLWKKQESSRKTSISALLTRLKPLTV